MWLALLGAKVSFSSCAVLNTPILLEPKAATYSVVPSLLIAMSQRCRQAVVLHAGRRPGSML